MENCVVDQITNKFNDFSKKVYNKYSDIYDVSITKTKSFEDFKSMDEHLTLMFSLHNTFDSITFNMNIIEVREELVICNKDLSIIISNNSNYTIPFDDNTILNNVNELDIFLEQLIEIIDSFESITKNLKSLKTDSWKNIENIRNGHIDKLLNEEN